MVSDTENDRQWQKYSRPQWQFLKTPIADVVEVSRELLDSEMAAEVVHIEISADCKSVACIPHLQAHSVSVEVPAVFTFPEQRDYP